MSKVLMRQSDGWLVIEADGVLIYEGHNPNPFELSEVFERLGHTTTLEEVREDDEY